PTDGLDPQGIHEVRLLLPRLQTDRGLTIMLSSHLLHEVERICNRIAIIDEGRLLYQGTVQSLLENDRQFKIRTDRTEQAFQFLSEGLNLPVFKNGNDHLYLKIAD